MVVILPKDNVVIWFCSMHNRTDNYLKGIIKCLNDNISFAKNRCCFLITNIGFPKNQCYFSKTISVFSKTDVVTDHSSFLKTDVDKHKESTKKGPPAKVLWYLPIIPRFKRLFANGDDAKDLT